MISADVVIGGGGVEGLVLLDEPTHQGYGCVLVTNSDLGSGQTHQDAQKLTPDRTARLPRRRCLARADSGRTARHE